MTEKEEVIGYYTEDGNIYCVECICKNIEILNQIDRAITAQDSEENLYVCDKCKEKIK
jgi:predicted SprT family Zn-dependent metalloprotease